jgi:hypothetical protein
MYIGANQSRKSPLESPRYNKGCNPNTGYNPGYNNLSYSTGYDNMGYNNGQISPLNRPNIPRIPIGSLYVPLWCLCLLWLACILHMKDNFLVI